ncbi:UvrD-helicase domain-containing protein [Virgibacillus salinus]|uniref:DNA helicase-2 / ATP-dependent DNA helicase PcrA n=1 Tax=Virgibacillus salinus TaxID=553311 RepID=A0A1H1DYQ5_9BACI|nr:UvrD-helicase domain-containing protein [Virgibacillus salinus]SDQ81389.1 DNA helicase-2 / ATP-dependent DNA helicase PcrA [Virgibacillus salinus]
MVKDRLKLEPEVQQVFNYMDSGDNFLLGGGAGSGKTYSLVQVINQVLAENPTDRIACITYTNAAVEEIEGRVKSRNLNVSTIHEFLWDNIKSYQIEIKKVLVDLINNEAYKNLKISGEDVNFDYFNDKVIQYKEYTLIKEGIISHDELLIVANLMFREYSKLCDIVKDKFKFIFIDEYQDTNKFVIEIFLDHFKNSNRENNVGFFGDAMQSIYDSGVEDLNDYISGREIQEVKKKQNRRNPRLVIKLANRLRTDGIVQEPSGDINAPNMQGGKVKEGKISFYYTTVEKSLDSFKQSLDWDFTDSKETKELNLTHNLIAPKAGFEELMTIYDGDKILSYKKRITDYIKKNNIETDFSGYSFGRVIDTLLEGKTEEAQQRPILPTATMKNFIDENPDLYERALEYSFDDFKKIYLDKDLLLDDKKEEYDDQLNAGSKRDNLIKHLFKIQDNISLYEKGKYNEFLRKTEFKITSIADKIEIKDIIVHLQNMSNSNIGEVIEFADESGICKKDDKFSSFIERQTYVYDRVKQVKFREFQNLFNYLEGYTPFTTQHKIKGAEFNNVLVVLDNGRWSNYNFEYLLNDNIFESLSSTKKASYPTILNRTRKLFYVCCTRAKENLIVYYHNPSQPLIEKAKSWFGDSNVLKI